MEVFAEETQAKSWPVTGKCYNRIIVTNVLARRVEMDMYRGAYTVDVWLTLEEAEELAVKLPAMLAEAEKRGE